MRELQRRWSPSQRDELLYQQLFEHADRLQLLKKAPLQIFMQSALVLLGLGKHELFM